MNEDVINYLRNTVWDLSINFIEEQTPFFMVLFNNDDWDKPLPENVMENNKDFLTIEISGETLQNIKYDYDNDIIHLQTYFNNVPFSKNVTIDDIHAVIVNDIMLCCVPILLPIQDKVDINGLMEITNNRYTEEELKQSIKVFSEKSENSDDNIDTTKV